MIGSDEPALDVELSDCPDSEGVATQVQVDQVDLDLAPHLVFAVLDERHQDLERTILPVVQQLQALVSLNHQFWLVVGEVNLMRLARVELLDIVHHLLYSWALALDNTSPAAESFERHHFKNRSPLLIVSLLSIVLNRVRVSSLILLLLFRLRDRLRFLRHSDDLAVERLRQTQLHPLVGPSVLLVGLEQVADGVELSEHEVLLLQLELKTLDLLAKYVFSLNRPVKPLHVVVELPQELISSALDTWFSCSQSLNKHWFGQSSLTLDSMRCGHGLIKEDQVTPCITDLLLAELQLDVGAVELLQVNHVQVEAVFELLAHGSEVQGLSPVDEFKHQAQSVDTEPLLAEHTALSRLDTLPDELLLLHQLSSIQLLQTGVWFESEALEEAAVLQSLVVVIHITQYLVVHVLKGLK